MEEIERAIERVRRDLVIRRLRDYPRQEETLRIAQATIHDLLQEIGGLRSPALSDMPRGSDTSDRTYRQTLKLPAVLGRVEELEQEIEDIKSKLLEIDGAVRQLNPTEIFVIESRYIRPVPQKQYRVLARSKGYAESTLKNAHTSAIKKIARILKDSTF